ncbi:FixH family protein [Ramlibacter sp.]|uniref:FixH family protein n=1 Tax=Ramlibacter sp. TaxID=1917967 RepID=UPI002BD49BA6|nr:FixH family protein [Ramlibacter sp.]HWI81189.1 FixH family protein [Ramlibacter sp.]
MTTPVSPSAPWWTFGHVWLLIAGPAIVIVAGVVTAWLAVSTPDPVVDADYYRRGLEINKQLAAEKALLPALQGRNHAATPTPQSR